MLVFVGAKHHVSSVRVSRCAETAGLRMKTRKILGLGLLLIGISTAAAAFQEQKSGGAPASSTPAVAQPSIGKDVGLAPDVAPKSTGGTEVRIPGLGKLGVLPKMDFGLELLYGAADQAKQPDAQQTTPSDDDLTIRGTVKHRW